MVCSRATACSDCSARDTQKSAESQASDQRIALLHEFGAHQLTPFAPIQAVAVGPDNRIWIVGGGRVQVCDGNCKILFPAADTKLHTPRCVAFDATTNEAFITDHSSCVIVCNLEGRFKEMLGADGSVKSPWGIAIDTKNGLVFVSQTVSNSVVALKRDGSVVRRIDLPILPGSVPQARGICLTASGLLVAADAGNNQIHVRSLHGPH